MFLFLFYQFQSRYSYKVCSKSFKSVYAYISISYRKQIKRYITEGGKRQENNITKKEKQRRLLISLVTLIALTNKVINKVSEALVTLSIGKTEIIT